MGCPKARDGTTSSSRRRRDDRRGGGIANAVTMENAKQAYAIMGADTPDGATNQWISGLSPDESYAVGYYTGPHYYEMNKHLREGKSIDAHGAQQIATLTEALKKGVLPEAVVLHRGGTSALIGGATTVEAINAKAGQIISDAGFMSSCTVKGQQFGGEVVYHIKTRAGKGIGAFVDPISHFSGEMEFLFQRGSAFKIVRGYQDGSQLHCELEYVGNEIS